MNNLHQHLKTEQLLNGTSSAVATATHWQVAIEQMLQSANPEETVCLIGIMQKINAFLSNKPVEEEDAEDIPYFLKPQAD